MRAMPQEGLGGAMARPRVQETFDGRDEPRQAELSKPGCARVLVTCAELREVKHGRTRSAPREETSANIMLTSHHSRGVS